MKYSMASSWPLIWIMVLITSLAVPAVLGLDSMISPLYSSLGRSSEVGATAIFNGCTHPNAAKLWIEYALSPECVDHAKEAGSYQFLVLSNGAQPEEAAKFGLDMNNTNSPPAA